MKKSLLTEGETRERLISSALNLLDHKPASEINFREIASLAGLSHMTAYRYFKSMDELFEAVAEEGYRRLTIDLYHCVELNQKEPRILLEQTFLTYFRFAQTHPHHLSAMFDRGVRKGQFKRTSFLEATLKLLEAYLSIIRICQKAGLFSGNWSESELGMMLWSFSHGYAVLETKAELKLVMHSRPNPEDFVRKGASVFIEGLKK